MEPSIERRLILVRHADPEIRPEVPPHLWSLSEAGRRRAAGLAGQLARLETELIVASDEPKAAETARIAAEALSVPWRTVNGLHEQDRREVGWLGPVKRFEARVAGLFAEPTKAVFGSESADAAEARIEAALARLQGEVVESTVAAISHGTVISLLVARANEVDPYTFWRQLDFGCAVELSRPDLRLIGIHHSEPPS